MTQTQVLPLQERNPGESRKIVIADVLVRDQQGKVLLVDDNLPGGTVGADESPWTTAQRALREGLGLDLSPNRLLVVDYVDDRLTLIFDAGMLSDAQADAIRARKAAFCDPGEAGELLPELGRPRLSAACEALRFNVSRYLQNGEILG
ncbi:NUDIX domain-containing protein [Cryptosporangium sp. NPDC048952]|uniref:NUDIX domain-containing protein n=1 Tax=Cryptosporangium sp. NPDC048952 TaxID=3363961 RepID=UPI0037103C2D